MNDNVLRNFAWKWAIIYGGFDKGYASWNSEKFQKWVYFNPLKTIWFCFNTHFPYTPARVYSGLVFNGSTMFANKVFVKLRKRKNLRTQIRVRFCDYCVLQMDYVYPGCWLCAGPDSQCDKLSVSGLTQDPHCAVIAVHDFNRRQSIFMTFRFILCNTTRLAPFPLWKYALTRRRTRISKDAARASNDCTGCPG